MEFILGFVIGFATATTGILTWAMLASAGRADDLAGRPRG